MAAKYSSLLVSPSLLDIAIAPTCHETREEENKISLPLCTLHAVYFEWRPDDDDAARRCFISFPAGVWQIVGRPHANMSLPGLKGSPTLAASAFTSKLSRSPPASTKQALQHSPSAHSLHSNNSLPNAPTLTPAHVSGSRSADWSQKMGTVARARSPVLSAQAPWNPLHVSAPKPQPHTRLLSLANSSPSPLALPPSDQGLSGPQRVKREQKRSHSDDIRPNHSLASLAPHPHPTSATPNPAARLSQLLLAAQPPPPAAPPATTLNTHVTVPHGHTHAVHSTPLAVHDLTLARTELFVQLCRCLQSAAVPQDVILCIARYCYPSLLLLLSYPAATPRLTLLQLRAPLQLQLQCLDAQSLGLHEHALDLMIGAALPEASAVRLLAFDCSAAPATALVPLGGARRPASCVWSALPSPAVGRVRSAVCEVGSGQWVVCGGSVPPTDSDAEESVTDAVEWYELPTGSGAGGWRSGPALSHAVQHAAVSVVPALGCVLLTGGCTASFQPVSHSQCLALPAATAWSCTATSALVQARFCHAMCVYAQKYVIVSGGRGVTAAYDGAAHSLASCESLELTAPHSVQWQPFPPLHTARCNHVMCELDGRLIVCGGITLPPAQLEPARDGLLPGVEVFDEQLRRWCPLLPVAPADANATATATATAFGEAVGVVL